jgi:hypothetical protein
MERSPELRELTLQRSSAEIPGTVVGLPALPPAPAHASAGMRRFNRLYAWGVGTAVAAMIVPQYLSLFTYYLDRPVPLIAYACIAPLFAVGSAVAIGVLVATPVRLFTHLRAQHDRRVHRPIRA